MSKRSALLIGVDNYNEQTIFKPLSNAVRDAKNLADVLKQLYLFDVEVVNGPKTASHLAKKISAFGKKTKDNAVSLVFLAGHGVRIDTQTYLVAEDCEDIDTRDDFERATISIQRQIEKFREHKGVVIFIVDCCRNLGGAYLRQQIRNWASESAHVPSLTLPNQIIVYSTQLDDTASDGVSDSEAVNDGDKAGLFTGRLIGALATDNVPLKRVLEEAARKTRDTSKNQRKQKNQNGFQAPQIIFPDELEGFYLRELDSLFKAPPAAAPVRRATSNILGLSVGLSGAHIVLIERGLSTGGKPSASCAILKSKDMLSGRRLSETEIFAQVKEKLVYACEIGPQNQVYLGCSDGSILKWRWISKQNPQILCHKHRGPVNELAFDHKKGVLLSVGCDNRVIVFDPESGLELASGHHDSWIWCISNHPEGQFFVTGSRDKSIRVWDRFDTEFSVGLSGCSLLKRRPIFLSDGVRAIRFSPDGHFIAAGTSNAEVSLLRFERGNFALEKLWRQRLQIKSDRPILAEEMAGKARLKSHKKSTVSAEHKKCTAVELRQKLAVTSIDFSPDGKILAVATNMNGLRIFDVKTGDEIDSSSYDIDWPRINSIRFCRQSRRLYAAAGSAIHVFEYGG